MQAAVPRVSVPPLFLVSISFLIGVFAAGSAMLPGWLPLFLFGVALAGSFAIWRSRLRLDWLVVFLLVALGLGLLRHQVAQAVIDEGHVASYNDVDQPFALTGVVVAPPDVRDSYIQLVVRAEQFREVNGSQFTQVEGQVLARVDSGTAVQYGDRVLVTGQLLTPPEDELFSYREYLARAGIYSYMPFADLALLETDQANPALAFIYSIREAALVRVGQLWPDPEAPLLAGILLGIESGIPQAVKDAFNDTGTSHIIAISGFNISILAALVAGALGRWLGPRRGAAAAALTIGLYTLLVGADAAVVRAALMGAIGLFARQVGRRQDGLNSLTLVAVLMALVNPFVLWDVGFQLSFAATLGLILYAGPFSTAFSGWIAPRVSPETAERLTGWAGEFLLFTLAANLTTLPLILYHFQRLAVYTLPANLLILPAQPAVMLGGGAALLLSFVWQPLGQAAAWLAWPFAAYTIRVVEFFAGLPGAARALGEIPGWAVIGFYLLLFTFPLYRQRIQIRRSLVVAALLIASVLLWNARGHAPDGLLHVTVFDVGAADSLLIQSPEGRYLLINGGPSPSTLADSLGRRLPLLDRSLDWWLIANPAEAQVAALPSLAGRYPPDAVLWAGNIQASRAARLLLGELTDAHIAVQDAEAGQVLDLGQGAQLQVLTTSARGASLAVTWGQFELLLPIGVTFADLDTLANRHPSALLLPEQGYAPLNPPDWLAGLEASLYLLSVDAGNRAGLPDKETLDAVEGTTLLRTDLNGWIELVTDGVQVWINTAYAAP